MMDQVTEFQPPVGSPTAPDIAKLVQIPGEVPHDLEVKIEEPMAHLRENRAENGMELTPEDSLQEFEKIRDTVVSDPTTSQERKEIYEQIDKAVQSGEMSPEAVINKLRNVEVPGATSQDNNEIASLLNEADETSIKEDPQEKAKGIRRLMEKMGNFYHGHPKLSMAFLGIFVLLGMVLKRSLKVNKGGAGQGYSAAA